MGTDNFLHPSTTTTTTTTITATATTTTQGQICQKKQGGQEFPKDLLTPIAIKCVYLFLLSKIVANNSRTLITGHHSSHYYRRRLKTTEHYLGLRHVTRFLVRSTIGITDIVLFAIEID